MRRTLLLIALLAAYAWTALHGIVIDALQRNRFDPFLPLARRLEQRIEEQRYADALPIALDLEKTYPSEPLVAYWIGRIRNGLGDRAAEAAAWERYVSISSTPAEACPALPEAYASIGKTGAALDAYTRCASFDPGDPDRLIDLGEAQRRAGRPSDALATLRRAATLDPDNPIVVRRIQSIAEDR
ncbi:MAG TPA: tetratricopeptide repeat protein [Vicinamibacterales bacterium]|jgi:tetratricopeptide (TPR) repeat protein|nr:tetratricopeptide repeat protein [Vicinamibacterales bacterium]